jgi:hypothetical protein
MTPVQAYPNHIRSALADNQLHNYSGRTTNEAGYRFKVQRCGWQFGARMPFAKDLSRIDSTGRAYAGSQRQIQTYVNEKTLALNFAIGQSLSQYALDEKRIQWVSPLAADCYSEYRDSEFLERVGLGRFASKLQEFWPQRGPCWDALAQIRGGCILVEAKSHVPEIYGGGCGATSPRSKQKIQEAFDATKVWLGVSQDVDWVGRLYQSANRYASLYFLREIAKVQAFLVNVYFIGDQISPTHLTKENWDTEIASVCRELGVISEVPYSSTVFLPAGQLRHILHKTKGPQPEAPSD